MKKILYAFLGVLLWLNAVVVSAVEKFEILPDLPEPLQAVHATTITTTDASSNIVGAAQNVGHEPNPISILFSLLFVVLLIYATGIIYTKLNKLGFKTLKQQMEDCNNSKVTVVSTTPLGTNKTLHVVELDGKRMLIGASSTSIHLIKDLGSYPHNDIETGEFSKIEIPDIRIPKIEIPRIEFPNIGFTKTTKNKTPNDSNENNTFENDDAEIKNINEDSVLSGILDEESDGIIDKLFKSSEQSSQEKSDNIDSIKKNEHKVDPEEYVLYKKYL